jgi:hypothetical protein
LVRPAQVIILITAFLSVVCFNAVRRTIDQNGKKDFIAKMPGGKYRRNASYNKCIVSYA